MPAHAFSQRMRVAMRVCTRALDAWAGDRPPYVAKKNAADYAAFWIAYLLPGALKYLKNSEFESITITSPCALKLAR